ncbi:hypothetical protein F4604DRAFT_555819 [Suillus subluteus]|nr:hypothetical protein F4604DRAFT_555819 [Suillus subluteus]
MVWSLKRTFSTLLRFSWVAGFQTVVFPLSGSIPYFCTTQTSARLASLGERLHGQYNALLEVTSVQEPCRAYCTSQPSEGV